MNSPNEISFSPGFVHRLFFTSDLFLQEPGVLERVLEPSGDQPARVQFWLDEHVAQARPELRGQLRAFVKARPDRLQMAGNVQIALGGEAVKNDIHILERMLKVFHAAKLDRRSYVVVVGGGAVLDAVGFAAAIAHRGLRLVRVPTTTLAQADSGVGVKNAVNLFGKKNWLGSFAAPWAVINDAALLTSLPDRDFVSGFSEAVKVFLLKDRENFDGLCRVAKAIRNRDMGAALPVIRDSAEWHRRHITQGGDPFEANEARPLDFGHWSAHRLEAMTDFRLRHGEAVAIGVALDTLYSSMVLGLPEEDAERVLRCLTDLGFRLSDPSLRDVDGLVEGLEEFRQHLGGRLTVTMLRGVGEPIDVHEMDSEKVREAVRRLMGREPTSRAGSGERREETSAVKNFTMRS